MPEVKALADTRAQLEDTASAKPGSLAATGDETAQRLFLLTNNKMKGQENEPNLLLRGVL